MIQTQVLKTVPSTGVSLTVEKTEGTKVRTKEYGELIDLASGCWAAVLGHCRKEITQTLAENAGSLFHTHQFFDSEHPTALVNEISAAAKFSGSYKGTFPSSGSDAVELGVKLSEVATGRKKKLSFAISNLGSAAELRLPRDPNVWMDLQIMDCIQCRKNYSCSQCGKFKEINFNEFASFVFEPGNSAGLVLCPPEKLIEYLSEQIRVAGGFIVVNEVTTGFGRTGKWFGFQHYNYFNSKENSPDFISLGKGLGNGYPISGLLVKLKLAEVIEKSGFKFDQSHLNDPLGCIVARKVVQIMQKDKLVEQGNATGEYFRHKLSEIAETTGEIKEIRGRGMMNIFVLSNNYEANKVFRRLLECGFFVEYSEVHNLIRLYAPLTTEYSEIDRFCLSLEDIFRR